MGDWRVKDQVIIVSGGSKGIGLATAQLLESRGARIAIFARDQARLEEVIANFEDPDRAIGIAADACNKSDFERALSTVVARWGRVDGLINNVGFQYARSLESMPEQEVVKLVNLNFLATVYGCQAVIPIMRSQGGGRIINVSSSSVRNDNEFADIGMYSANKAAVEKFTGELRHDVKHDGIMLTVFSPGSTATGSIENFDPDAAGAALKKWLARGDHFDGATTPDVMAEGIAHCFEYPPGVAVEFMEVRANIPTPKALESNW